MSKIHLDKLENDTFLFIEQKTLFWIEHEELVFCLAFFNSSPLNSSNTIEVFAFAVKQEAQDAFQISQYSDLQVLAIYESTSERKDATVYEFELSKAEVASSEESSATTEGMEGIETEKVSERQPDIILHIDEKGEIVKEENMDEEK